MVCLGFEPGAAGWKVQTNPLSYGGTPTVNVFALQKGNLQLMYVFKSLFSR